MEYLQQGLLLSVMQPAEIWSANIKKNVGAATALTTECKTWEPSLLTVTGGIPQHLQFTLWEYFEAAAEKTHQTRDESSAAGFAKHTEYPLTGLSSGIERRGFSFFDGRPSSKIVTLF